MATGHTTAQAERKSKRNENTIKLPPASGAFGRRISRAAEIRVT
jgi:hypothetical protein